MNYIKNPDTTSPLQLLTKFFSTYSLNTYSTPSLSVGNCYAIRRSFSDICDIVNTYFPKTSREDVAKIMVELWKNKIITGWYCTDINKWVYFKYEGVQTYDEDCRDEEGNDISYNDMLKLAEKLKT